MKKLSRIVVFLMLGGIALFSIPNARTQAQKDDNPSAPSAVFTVTNASDSGPGSLRQAMLDSNAAPGTDTINFNIPGSGVRTISPATSFPIITSPVIIDGTTQPGFSGTPIIELNGSGVGLSACLSITVGNSRVQGLVINRFAAHGIYMETGGGNVIEGNFIGTDASGTVDLGNLQDGVVMLDSGNNRIGGTTNGARNVLSGNNGAGVSIVNPGSTGNVIQGNFIGTNTAGAGAVGNRAGVFVGFSASGNTIGGATAETRNIISGNTQDGIVLNGVGTNNNIIQGNYIGTNLAGTATVANNIVGIRISVGTGTIIRSNVVSGNDSSGILFFSSASRSIVEGNFIGINAAGSSPLANRSQGILILDGANNNMIGGTTAAARNVISGNTFGGIVVAGSTTNNNTIQGNYVGTNASGTAAIPSTDHGIRLAEVSGSTIRGNVVAGYDQVGILLHIGANNNVIDGNFVGTDATGTIAMPNRDGIEIRSSSNNLLGGSSAGFANIVAFNNDAGVRIGLGMGNAVLRNSIFSNGSDASDLGIELDSGGITPNDVGDADTGANNLQNFPVLTTAAASGNSTTIQGSLNSLANTTFRVEFFSNTACDVSGNGEGKTYLGSANVTTNGGGDAAINASVGALSGGFITSTATRLNIEGIPTDTSEFSACLATAGGTGGDLLFTTNRNGNTEIYKMNADGTNQQRLTNTPQAESQALWSPNGQKILYGKTIGTGNSQIWLMNSDGSGQTLISDATAANGGPKWSPNGQKILFTRRETGGTDQVWTMNADGSNRIRLTNTATHDHFPDWSPDGARIAFGRCNLSFVCDIFTINADGSNPTNLTPTNPNDDDHPNWTPDGSKIVFGGQTTPEDYNAFVMNANGSGRLPLTTSVAPASFQPGGVFSVSPDGSKVALGSRDGSAGSGGIEIQTVSINGANLTNLTNNAVFDFFSVWSPNGSKIAFGSRRDATTNEIYTMNADGSGVQRLTNNTVSDVLTDWFRAPTDFCSNVPIGIGQSTASGLNNASCVIGSDKTDLYTFTGTANQQIAISMETTQFFSKIELLNPSGTVIATVGGVNGINNSRLPGSGFFTLASTGTYTIRAVAAVGGSGAYTLSLYQAPVVNCTYSLSPSVTSAAATGGTFYFDVITQPGCPPASQPAASGVIYNGVTYNGGRITFNVLANSGAARSDTITVAGLPHAINQFGVAAPTNDNFANSQTLTGINSPPNAPINGYNSTATAESGEPEHAGSPASKSVWYGWTPPAGANGLYSFSTSGSSFDTVMAIYACPAAGTCSPTNIIPVGSNDDTTFFDTTSKVNFRALVGTQYLIAVDGKNGAAGTIELSWRQYQRLYRLYLQNYNGNQSPLVPDSVTASNGSNTVIPLLVSQGVYEFNLPADNTVYNVTITGPTGIVWDPNSFPLDTSFGLLDELMNGGPGGGANSVSNAQNQTPRYIYGYIRQITGQELPSLSVIIGSSRGPNPRDAAGCSPLGSTILNSTPYATYQCLSQPQTLHDIVPRMAGKSFTISVLSYDHPINTNEYGLPSTGFLASNVPTYDIGGHVLAGGAGTIVDLSYTPTGNNLEISLRTVTDGTGAYTFANLPANNYRLRASRTGYVFIQPAKINLQANETIDIQPESSCTYTPANLATIPIGGGLSQFMVNTNQPTCEWQATSDVSWITINSGAIVGTGPIHFTAEPNAGPGRIGSIRVAGRPDPVYVQQASSNPTFAIVSGRVATPDGRGLRNAVVTIIDSNGVRQTAVTSSFGLFTFGNIETGQVYTLTATSKRYRFAPRTVQITGNASNVDFIGLE